MARYLPDEEIEGVRGDEGTFLMGSFSRVQARAAIGRHDEATTLFERLLDVRNDVGLPAEEHHAGDGRFLGNFPQAFSHVGLVDAARALEAPEEGPERAKE